VQNHQIDPSGPQTETAAAPIAAQVMRAYLNGHGG
jgi:hypothetical protein